MRAGAGGMNWYRARADQRSCDWVNILTAQWKRDRQIFAVYVIREINFTDGSPLCHCVGLAQSLAQPSAPTASHPQSFSGVGGFA
ncbi:hypothetical protein Terro_3157 [Terriglobus roseus DSM 18391]|uniref:Uncharacterized protein n=1 Tax=Terriglobus roseus (strain DSM 18391 / NRRL B-41598 / KBS 63) TaxID=926566 RepID=I3ZJG5_TERRK|nr:hypothetical protein Terro_3157 [Terriglobus roseus DSM 18391]